MAAALHTRLLKVLVVSSLAQVRGLALERRLVRGVLQEALEGQRRKRVALEGQLANGGPGAPPPPPPADEKSSDV